MTGLEPIGDNTVLIGRDFRILIPDGIGTFQVSSGEWIGTLTIKAVGSERFIDSLVLFRPAEPRD
jgi:hypothetical protein